MYLLHILTLQGLEGQLYSIANVMHVIVAFAVRLSAMKVEQRAIVHLQLHQRAKLTNETPDSAILFLANFIH